MRRSSKLIYVTECVNEDVVGWVPIGNYEREAAELGQVSVDTGLTAGAKQDCWLGKSLRLVHGAAKWQRLSGWFSHQACGTVVVLSSPLTSLMSYTHRLDKTINPET